MSFEGPRQTSWNIPYKQRIQRHDTFWRWLVFFWVPYSSAVQLFRRPMKPRHIAPIIATITGYVRLCVLTSYHCVSCLARRNGDSGCLRPTVPCRCDLSTPRRASPTSTTMTDRIRRQNGNREELGILRHALRCDALELMPLQTGTSLLHPAPRATRRRVPRQLRPAPDAVACVVPQRVR